MPPLDLETLRVIAAVAEHRSFTEAGRRLFRSQPSVSYTVAKLESDLGVQVFRRTSRVVEPTPAGSELIEQGRQILRSATLLEARMRRRALDQCASASVYLDPALCIDATDSFVVPEDGLQSRTICAVNAGRCFGGDLNERSAPSAYIGRKDVFASRGWASLPIGTLEWAYAAAASHRYVSKRGAPHADPLVIEAEESRLDAQPSVCWESRRAYRMRVPDVATQIARQVAGVGVGLLPEHAIRAFEDAGLLTRLRFASPGVRQEIHLAWPSWAGRSRVEEWKRRLGSSRKLKAWLDCHAQSALRAFIHAGGVGGAIETNPSPRPSTNLQSTAGR
jgi:DNA-binding transcriptional LysR family regulator